ncbi:predicted protein [Naegleria gruberi]|uniref:Predicted protein n=1 Tax=Naegleria gruberi TaxID=5762 RepID=D2W6E3_NAEGR|nr:uncharacterized protein NAEGRDRAFT_76986 [Naegleria gruberi]EFC35360.1 predicted protein [Naegleria gruberi]|eukprot:XP_002668104.1 predicted protein [Naegleria gruberi strain NEG-M]
MKINMRNTFTIILANQQTDKRWAETHANGFISKVKSHINTSIVTKITDDIECKLKTTYMDPETTSKIAFKMSFEEKNWAYVLRFALNTNALLTEIFEDDFKEKVIHALKYHKKGFEEQKEVLQNRIVDSIQEWKGLFVNFSVLHSKKLFPISSTNTL